ncbi:preprotein translocase subunit SecG [Treponema sp.]|uniref:preprotein translocase subunit SecG n=1 Tax=Treponema sp. TaxID=166 RepID=UPI003FD87E7A
MGVVRTILLVAFVIICVLLVLLVLVQNEDNNGMGSAFGGGQSAAFGAHSASVLTKTTGVFVALFFIVAFSLSLLNKAPARASLDDAAVQVQGAEETASSSDSSWIDQELENEVPQQTISDPSAQKTE